MTDYEKIKIVRKALKKNQAEFAAEFNILQSTYSSYETGAKDVPKNLIRLLLTEYGVSREWWENGKEPVFMEKSINGTSAHKESFKLAGAPYYDIDATAGNVTVFNGETNEEIKSYINIPSFHSCKAFINVKGHSMYPKYQSGDIIGLIPVEDIELIQYGEAYLIISLDSQRMIKIIRKHKEKDDHVILHNENEKFDDFDLPKRKIHKLYLVKGPIRDGVMG